jgi:predicted ABC-type ATPase
MPAAKMQESAAVVKRLRMFAGPNGSGKTSLAERLSGEGHFQLNRYVNADNLFESLASGIGIDLHFLEQTSIEERIRNALLLGGRLSHDHPFFDAFVIVGGRLHAQASASDGYVAAALCDFLRAELISTGESFSFETVMSHRSKVIEFQRARALGYRTYLYFIATDAPELNIHRIKNRIALGGHSVPESKIIDRYIRSLSLLGDAMASADRGFLFDNSGDQPIWLAELTPDGKLHSKIASGEMPAWYARSVSTRFSAG